MYWLLVMDYGLLVIGFWLYYFFCFFVYFCCIWGPIGPNGPQLFMFLIDRIIFWLFVCFSNWLIILMHLWWLELGRLYFYFCPAPPRGVQGGRAGSPPARIFRHFFKMMKYDRNHQKTHEKRWKTCLKLWFICIFDVCSKICFFDFFGVGNDRKSSGIWNKTI